MSLCSSASLLLSVDVRIHALGVYTKEVELVVVLLRLAVSVDVRLRVSQGSVEEV